MRKANEVGKTRCRAAPEMGRPSAVAQALLCPLPDAAGGRHVHVERSDHAELRNFYADVNEMEQLLRDAFFLLAEEEDHFRREFVMVEGHRVRGLLEPDDDPALGLLS